MKCYQNLAKKISGLLKYTFDGLITLNDLKNGCNFLSDLHVVLVEPLDLGRRHHAEVDQPRLKRDQSYRHELNEIPWKRFQ